MITTPNSFTAEITIANSNVSPTLTTVINKYEPLFLEQLFGASFANLFIENLGDDGRFAALNTASLQTAIANFIYCKYQDYKNSDASNTGVVKSKDTNAEPFGVGDKICRAWNEMVDINWNAIPLDAEVYPEYVQPDWYSGMHPIFSSANYRGFATVYIPDIFVKKNKFGI